jgi:glycosyltransferase involved in cell wall biosynthesis
MTVLHLISGRGPTGAAAAAITDILSLRAAGVRACVAIRGDHPSIREALLSAGVPFTDIFSGFKFGRGAMGMLTALRDASHLSNIILSESVDVLHVHRAAEHWLAMLIPGRSRRSKLIRTWHRNPQGEHRPVLSTMAGNTAGCVCVAREHEAVLLGAGTPRARFIHGAVDTDFFRPRQRLNDGPIVVAQAARWKRERGRDRGQRFTLEIFSKLSTALYWRGELIGRGELEREFRHYAFDELKLPAGRVSVVGTQGKSPDDFASLLSGLGLGLAFCIGSDGSSRPALEMLACGVPLLVADTQGLREMSDGTDCVKLGPKGGADEWARAIEALLRHPETILAMQHNARKRAETVHSFRARGEALAAFYRECVVGCDAE